MTEGADADLSEHEEGERFGRTEKEKAKLREERNAAKQMEATYWLEMVDSKHRCAFCPPLGPPSLVPDLVPPLAVMRRISSGTIRSGTRAKPPTISSMYVCRSCHSPVRGGGS